MKRSIKILAGTILFVMLVIITHYTALLAMKKSGKYTEVYLHPEENPTVVYPENIQQISIQGFNDVQLVMSDTFYFSYEDPNPELNHVHWNINGGTLSFQGDTTYIDTNRDMTIDTVHDLAANVLTIYLTGREKLSISECTTHLRLLDEPVNLDAQLEHSSLEVSWDYRSEQGKGPFRNRYYSIKNLQLKALGSNIDLGANGLFENINVQLSGHSTFDDGGSEVRQGTIGYDATCGIKMTGANIPRLRLERENE